jgi:hypothetical protein
MTRKTDLDERVVLKYNLEKLDEVVDWLRMGTSGRLLYAR